MNNKHVRFLSHSALIAALYVVLTMAFAPISFGVIQFRISEVLTVLPYFTPAAIPGVSIGCFLANLLTGAPILDIVFGALATLIGAVVSYLVRRWPYLVPIPPILSNTLIVPWVLRYAYGSPDSIPYMMVTVGVGEILAIGVLGTLLLILLRRCGAQRIFSLTK